MDLQLKEAAINGDVEFLKNSLIASQKPIEYYLTVFPNNQPREDLSGNIFHIAARENKVEFIKLVIQHLPTDALQQLLLQKSGPSNCNPLHVVAELGHHEIVKLFLSVYKSPSSSPSPSPSPSPLSSTSYRKPWLEKDDTGRIPCEVALIYMHEDCVLEILNMDLDLLSNMDNVNGGSLLFSAVSKGLKRVAMKILMSASSCNFNGEYGYTPLHFVSKCSVEICELILKRKPDLIIQKSVYGLSAFDYWAMDGSTIWLFEYIFKSNNISPEVKRYIVELIESYKHKYWNVLHYLAKGYHHEDNAIRITQLFIYAYKAWSVSEHDQLPWFKQDLDEVLSIAIRNQRQKFAIYIMSVNNVTNIDCQQPNYLFLAIEARCHAVAEKILDLVETNGWTHLLTNHEQLNVLHLAPSCKEDFCKRILKNYPFLLKGVDPSNGGTVLHSWVKKIVEEDQVWLFKYVLGSGEIDPKWRSYFISFLHTMNNDNQNPLHCAAVSKYEAIDDVVKLLVEAYRKQLVSEGCYDLSDDPPWFVMDGVGNGPLHTAIRAKRTKLAKYVLSLLDMIYVVECYNPLHRTVFLAIENECYEVAQELITRFFELTDRSSLVDSSSGRTALHLLATRCTDRTFCKWLVNEAPEWITQPDQHNKTPLDEASTVGAAWIIEEMLKKVPSALDSAPFAWVEACERGHISAIRAFIDHCRDFRNHCLQHHDSPLHHIRLQSLREYEEFLSIPLMKDLINVKDSHGATPLHIAIRNRDIYLTEALLKRDGVKLNIKDSGNYTAKELLSELYTEDPQWDEMCKRVGIDPSIKIAFFEGRTNMLDVRNTLSVVAALLATLTFTAGFTLPGGLNQEDGHAILGKKAAFLVFILADTMAMCFSMLVLICLIWSMVCDSNKSLSLLLIDRSMVILMIALYCTLVAFMSGVFVVISPRSLWAAILIIVMCCLVGFSANKTILLVIVDKVIPSWNSNEEDENQVPLLELGHMPEYQRREYATP